MFRNVLTFFSMLYIVVQGKGTLILGRLKNVMGSQIPTEALYRTNTVRISALKMSRNQHNQKKDWF